MFPPFNMAQGGRDVSSLPALCLIYIEEPPNTYLVRFVYAGVLVHTIRRQVLVLQAPRSYTSFGNANFPKKTGVS